MTIKPSVEKMEIWKILTSIEVNSTMLMGAEKSLDVTMVFEELAELAAEYAKLQRGNSSNEDVASEIADVLLVCIQLSVRVGAFTVSEKICEKADRLRYKLEHAKKVDELRQRLTAVKED